MSEFDGQVSGNSDAAQDMLAQEGAAAPVQSPGALLRQAREAAGLHIAALAVALKVPVKKLEALESDRLELLPDAVFVRALASSVCRNLKMDPAEVLALLPQTGRPRLGEQRASLNTPFRPPSQGPGPSLWTHVSRPAVPAGLLLVLGALVLVFMPAVQQQNAAQEGGGDPVVVLSPPQSPLVTTDVSTLPMQGDSPPAVSEIVAAPMAPAEALPAAPPLALGLMAAPVPAPTALPLVSPAAAAALPAATLPATAAAAAAGGTIVFTAKGESWVEVTDAKGVVVLRRTLAAGETAGASGVLPLAAVVGRVDATQVQVRGKPFDLGSVAKDNVARFEVK